MKSVRTRITFLSTIAFTIMLAFGFLTLSTFRNYTRIENEFRQSYSLTDDALQLTQRQIPDSRRAELAQIAEGLLPEFRSTALKRLLKNPNNENLNFLFRAEGEYRKYSLPLLDYYKKTLRYQATVTWSVSLLLVAGLLALVRRQIFRPIRNLSKKMVDFLNNKFSYEFTVPEPNEIGELHSTFNDLAQKVLGQIDELKSLDKAKSDFLSIASHELRTPLTSIKGSLSLLSTGVGGDISETTKNLMSIALEETDRLIRLINEILDLAKIEARQFPLSCNWLSAFELTERTFSSLKGFCESAEIKLDHIGDQNIELFVDSDRIQQVLTNLLSNAVKYSPKGSTVMVKYVINEHQEMRVEIVDQGPGIAPEDQAIIFEKFRQATSPQNPLVKGTGLGLAIAKALVEEHGGSIGVHSVPNEGSTFYFTLPKWRPNNLQSMVAS